MPQPRMQARLPACECRPTAPRRAGCSNTCCCFFERLAARAPLLMVIEDVHWADRSTLDLLGFLARNLRQGPIVLVVSYRSDELHRRHPLLPFLAEQERSGRAERLELGRFDRSELAAQLAAILGVEPDPELVERILARSEGNAFYAEELLASRHDAAGSRHAAGGAAGARRDAERAGPGAACASRRRVGSGSHRRCWRASAGPTNANSIAPSARRSPVTSSCSGKDRRRSGTPSVTPLSTRRSTATCCRASGRDSMPRLREPSPRRRAEADASRAAELAYHWQAAHDLPRAFDAWIQRGPRGGGDLRLRRGPSDFEHALELWDQVPDAAARAPLDRVELLTRAAFHAAGPAPIRSVAYIREAISLVDPDSRPHACRAAPGATRSVQLVPCRPRDDPRGVPGGGPPGAGRTALGCPVVGPVRTRPLLRRDGPAGRGRPAVRRGTLGGARGRRPAGREPGARAAWQGHGAVG